MLIAFLLRILQTLTSQLSLSTMKISQKPSLVNSLGSLAQKFQTSSFGEINKASSDISKCILNNAKLDALVKNKYGTDF
jgi:hypothetical protein